MNFLKRKETLIIVAALVLPGGLAALGLWKAYDLYKAKRKSKEDAKNQKPVV